METMLLFIFILILLTVFVLQSHYQGGKEKAKAKAKPKEKESKSLVYLYMPPLEIEKIKKREKTYQIRYPKLEDGLQWSKCVGCKILYFSLPKDVSREDSIKSTYEKHKSVITDFVEVEVSEVEEYKSLDDLMKNKKIKDQREDISSRFSPMRIEELGLAIIFFK